MRIIASFLSLVLLFSCNEAEQAQLPDSNTLASLTQSLPFVTGAVIACASGVEGTTDVRAYFYPRPGVSELRYFETDHTAVDPQDYSNYSEIPLNPQDLFNGYLRFYQRDLTEEKWVIISFVENDTLQLSNPIRLKQATQNSLFSDQIQVSQPINAMPQFEWSGIAQSDDAIYFQVISNSDGDLLSGTYTLNPEFQYYNTDNVVLNITRELPPPNLEPGQTYQITVMGVSEDNWVNLLAMRSFEVEQP